jgi:hypothetical protein
MKIILIIIAVILFLFMVIASGLERRTELYNRIDNCKGHLVKRYDDKLVCVDYEKN